MSKTAKIMMAVFGGFMTLVVIGIIYAVTSYISARDYAGQTEVRIEAKYKDNQNIFSSYMQLMQTQVQIPEMARDDIMKVIEKSMQGRYGKDGSKAVFQAIQEVNPSVDPSLYRKIQQIDEAKRNEFQQAQTGLIDIKRGYGEQRALTIRGFWIQLAGFPKIDLNKFDIVTDDLTEKTFETKRATPLQLRPKAEPAAAPAAGQ